MKFSSKIGIIATIATLTGMAASAAFAQQPPREMKPLPRAEALKMAGERFDAADENHDGQLSAEEARAGRPEGRPPEAQGQGQKSKQRPALERQGAFGPISRADALKREAERFDASDRNGDGVLSVEEQREARPPRR
ncbi:MAG: hypothetical protein ACJASC_003229 [Limimaricola cinnabarinus]|jgi:hypothetical protein|uniref:hypothetical protein n=1 Tax=Limimaricola cinnabarinus TaxID=1125964 RepID=UPI0039E43282